MAGVEGLEAFRRRVAAIPAEFRAAAQPALDKAAAEAVREMKALAPADKGELRASIRSEPGDHDLSRKIIAGDETSPQATYVEFGTVHMDAEPFFWIVIRNLMRRRNGQVQRAWKKALKKYSE